MNVLEHLTNLFAPDDCLVCGREGSLLCAACMGALPALPGRCFGCDAAVDGVSCERCLLNSGLTSLRAAVHYQDAAQALVGSLKFKGNQSASRIMARAMNSLLPMEHCIVTHMPATAAHIRQRGYDQAEIIARHLSLPVGVQRLTLLARSGKQHQLGADREQRLRQLSSSLRVIRAERVRGMHVVLVDDVLTTGASLRAATAALLEAGVASVQGVVFAQAVHTKK